MVGYEDGHVDKQIRRYNYGFKSKTRTFSNFPSRHSKNQGNTDSNVTKDLIRSLESSKSNSNKTDTKNKRKNKSNNKNKPKYSKKEKKQDKLNNKNKKNNKKHYNFKFSRFHKRSMQPFINADQWDLCYHGLVEDAFRQMNYIERLIKKSNDKKHIENLMDEVQRFVKLHNLSEGKLKHKKQSLNSCYKKKFN